MTRCRGSMRWRTMFWPISDGPSIAGAGSLNGRRGPVVAMLQAPEVQLVRQEEAAEVLDALGRLRARDQEIIQLALWEELKPAEIAQVLGISRPAVDQRLYRARQRLARDLNRQASRWDLRSKLHLGTEV